MHVQETSQLQSLRFALLAVIGLVAAGCTGAAAEDADDVREDLADSDDALTATAEAMTRFVSGICTVDGVRSRGYPKNPRTGAAACPPYARPAVFLSPHADDETLGMANAIREHVRAGRDVFVELMTHGGDSRACTRRGLDRATCGDQRVTEFLLATARLGVKGVFVNEFDAPVASKPGTYRSFTENDVVGRIDFWKAQHRSGEISFKGTAPEDHPAHIAVYKGLVRAGGPEIRSYFVHHFDPQSASHLPMVTVEATPRQCDEKRLAMLAYTSSRELRNGGPFGIGYASVKVMFDNAGLLGTGSCVEYMSRDRTLVK